MIAAPIPANEKKRLDALFKFGLLDSPAEEGYDELVQLASAICQAPISLLTLIDPDRQWFKASVGVSVKETPRDIAFCGYTILGEELVEVPDTLLDERFKDNPLVMGEPHVRFYAGIPLLTRDGCALGSLCVLDVQPRQLNSDQRFALQVLSRQVVSRIEAEYQARQLREIQRQLQEREPKILDSIRYGDLIHKSLMPRRSVLHEQFQECFILWKPRDIIANNFCFLQEEGDHLFVGVVDCMDQCFDNPFFGTLINDYLQQIIGQGTFGTATILQELHKRLARMWPHNSKLAARGISMGLCRVSKKQQTLIFSAADQELHFINGNHGFQSLKGNKTRLGKKEEKGAFARYTEKKIPLEKDITFYLLGRDMQEPSAETGKRVPWEILKKSINFQGTAMNVQPSEILHILSDKSGRFQQQEYDLLVVGFKATGKKPVKSAVDLAG